MDCDTPLTCSKMTPVKLNVVVEGGGRRRIRDSALWTPKTENIDKSAMTAFMKQINEKYNQST